MRLNELVNGLTVTPRVLLIGARPNDADEDLIAWLARGHHVQTGFPRSRVARAHRTTRGSRGRNARRSARAGADRGTAHRRR